MAAKTNNDGADAPAGVSDELWAESMLEAAEYLSVLIGDLPEDQHRALTMQYSAFCAARALACERDVETWATHAAAVADLQDAYVAFRTAAESTIGSELATEYFGSLDDAVDFASKVKAHLAQMIADGDLQYSDDE